MISVLNLQELSRYLRVGKDKARDLVKTGAIPARNLGTDKRPSWRILRAAADDFLMKGGV